MVIKLCIEEVFSDVLCKIIAQTVIIFEVYLILQLSNPLFVGIVKRDTQRVWFPTWSKNYLMEMSFKIGFWSDEYFFVIISFGGNISLLRLVNCSSSLDNGAYSSGQKIIKSALLVIKKGIISMEWLKRKNIFHFILLIHLFPTLIHLIPAYWF